MPSESECVPAPRAAAACLVTDDMAKRQASTASSLVVVADIDWKGIGVHLLRIQRDAPARVAHVSLTVECLACSSG